ncbi:recombinase family protein [Cyanobium sp. BA5m-10]|uniref:recombinase family protein n=1 Tax=Cyanobium sp. BA5m-10 TaxID=2823705 RepID=UPI0020CD717E|nr:recombinase family protein [Cyanobium sp. BA5m-10]MCP9903125.1 recombinase family protein [Cyanobium sp. BA5m-10]
MAPEISQRVAGYLRVSSASQRDESDSPASQRQRLKQAGAGRIFEDLAVSGFDLDARQKAKGYRDLLAAIEAGEIDKLITVRLDRIARRDGLVLQVAEACDRSGVEFLSLGSGPVDVSTSAGWLSVKVQLLLGEHYSRALAENVRNGYAGLHSQGIPARSAASLPIHLQRIEGTRHGVEPSPAWGDCRTVIDRFLAGQWRLADAATFLHERHGRMGHGRTVGFWLRGKHLLGHMATRTGDIQIKDCWPALVTPAEYERIQLQLQENRRLWGRNIPQPPEEGGPRPTREIRALSGLCRCHHCGSVLAYSVARRPQGSYGYLRCSQQQCPSRRAGIRADALEQALVVQLLGDHLGHIALALAAADDDHHIPSSKLIELRQELAAREKLPSQFRTDQDQLRIRELRQLIAAEQRTPVEPDPALVALLDERLRHVPIDSGWGEAFHGQIHSDRWGWTDAPGMDRSEQQRHQDLALLIEPGGLLVDTVPRDRHLWIKQIRWRIAVWGPDGPMVEGEPSAER